MVTQQPEPIVIDYPNNAYGTSLPTDGPPSPTQCDLSTETTIAQLVAQGALVDSQISLIPIPTETNCCFRDAVLTGLFSTKPFVGFLQHWSVQETSNTTDNTSNSGRKYIISQLQRLVQLFYQGTGDEKTKRNAIASSAKQFHQNWTNFGDKDATAQDDAPLYLQALFQALDPQNTEEDDIVIDDTFHPTFSSEFVSRSAFACACATKMRNPYQSSDRGFISLLSVDSSSPTIKSAFENSLYAVQGDQNAKCPRCGVETSLHRYFKFRYFPEVIFLQLEYPMKDKDGSIIRDSSLRCALPEELDLDALSDKIDQSKGQAETDPAKKQELQRSLPNQVGTDINVAKDSRYRLQFVLDYSGKTTRTTSAGHYRCHIRRANNNWELFDGMKRHSQAQASSMLQMESDTVFQPRLLAYVRQHDASQPGVQGQATQTSDQTRNQTGASSAPDYDNLDIEALRLEISKRGLLLPQKKDDTALRALLKHHDSDPKDYNLFTVKHLVQLITERNLNRNGKRPLVKKQMIKCLADHDNGISPATDPAQSTASGDANLAANVKALESRVEAMQSQLDIIMKAVTAQPAQQPSTATNVQAAGATGAPQATNLLLSQATGEVEALKEKCAKLEEQSQGTLAQLKDRKLYCFSIKVGLDGWASMQQYLIEPETNDRGERFGAPLTSWTLVPDPQRSSHSLLRVLFIDGTKQHAIDIPIQGNVDANSLKVVLETELCSLSAAFLIRQSEDNSIPAAPAQGRKRSISQLPEVSSPSGETSSKKQKTG